MISSFCFWRHVLLKNKILEKSHVCVEITKVKTDRLPPAYYQPTTCQKTVFDPVCSSYWLRNQGNNEHTRDKMCIRASPLVGMACVYFAWFLKVNTSEIFTNEIFYQ